MFDTRRKKRHDIYILVDITKYLNDTDVKLHRKENLIISQQYESCSDNNSTLGNANKILKLSTFLYKHITLDCVYHLVGDLLLYIKGTL